MYPAGQLSSQRLRETNGGPGVERTRGFRTFWGCMYGYRKAGGVLPDSGCGFLSVQQRPYIIPLYSGRL